MRLSEFPLFLLSCGEQKGFFLLTAIADDENPGEIIGIVGCNCLALDIADSSVDITKFDACDAGYILFIGLIVLS